MLSTSGLSGGPPVQPLPPRLPRPEVSSGAHLCGAHRHQPLPLARGLLLLLRLVLLRRRRRRPGRLLAGPVVVRLAAGGEAAEPGAARAELSVLRRLFHQPWPAAAGT